MISMILEVLLAIVFQVDMLLQMVNSKTLCHKKKIKVGRPIITVLIEVLVSGTKQGCKLYASMRNYFAGIWILVVCSLLGECVLYLPIVDNLQLLTNS